MALNEFEFPIERVDLPSKGILYPSTSPLSKGYVEMKYLSAKEEDILTNRTYMRDNTVIDKLFESLIVTPGVTISELLSGDIDALFFACRVLSYGNEYEFLRIHPDTGKQETAVADLEQIELKYIDEEAANAPGINEFNFTLPHSKKVITFKLLTREDKDNMKLEAKSWAKSFPGQSYEKALFLIHSIIAIDDVREQKVIRAFIEKGQMTAMDANKLRQYISKISPGVITNVNITFIKDKTVEEDVELPITQSFFWPDVL